MQSGCRGVRVSSGFHEHEWSTPMQPSRPARLWTGPSDLTMEGTVSYALFSAWAIHGDCSGDLNQAPLISQQPFRSTLVWLWVSGGSWLGWPSPHPPASGLLPPVGRHFCLGLGYFCTFSEQGIDSSLVLLISFKGLVHRPVWEGRDTVSVQSEEQTGRLPFMEERASLRCGQLSWGFLHVALWDCSLEKQNEKYWNSSCCHCCDSLTILHLS